MGKEQLHGDMTHAKDLKKMAFVNWILQANQTATSVFSVFFFQLSALTYMTRTLAKKSRHEVIARNFHAA